MPTTPSRCGSQSQSKAATPATLAPSRYIISTLTRTPDSGGLVNNSREHWAFPFTRAICARKQLPTVTRRDAKLFASHRRVLDASTNQEAVFETVARPVADSVLEGFNGTIFAYGQTGSGKTFTITGGAERYVDRGIIPRVIAYLFAKVAERPEQIYEVRVSYLEIYNEVGYDLLDEKQDTQSMEDPPKASLLGGQGHSAASSETSRGHSRRYRCSRMRTARFTFETSPPSWRAPRKRR